ncbi:uncharacterized protein YneR [Scopulibacillus darangshiensis]|uniref:Uncharacterized protein YneR n=1 Tax=Scopulibacillus darangshiensis TaxID=442528 RepID=A0A4R2NEL7_9BACL|nr:HesB/YadR/YfhF family protein [Scopulibacillus darangshiensis]TCP19759.1 uncharacterized protein YneR [Scopulibacillus darangshiensis]
MKITVTDEAVDWFKEELEVTAGDHVRFFVRYGGNSTIQEGFSLGLTVEKPHNIAANTIEDDITFFVEDEDVWYFKDYDLKVDFEEKTGEIDFNYREAGK